MSAAETRRALEAFQRAIETGDLQSLVDQLAPDVVLLGDGSRFGIRFEYAVQPKPEGIAQAFLIGRDFLAGNASALILGDNIFYGDNLRLMLRNSTTQTRGATVFACWVDDPERYAARPRTSRRDEGEAEPRPPPLPARQNRYSSAQRPRNLHPNYLLPVRTAEQVPASPADLPGCKPACTCNGDPSGTGRLFAAPAPAPSAGRG